MDDPQTAGFPDWLVNRVMRSKLVYRVWQFWQSLKKPPGMEEWQKVETILTQPELTLFESLPVQDQNHSLRVLANLEANGETDADLLKAALLHDIGKTCCPLARWERVFAVMMEGLFPRAALEWGRKEPQGIWRSLVTIQQHPAWGADMAQKAGSSQKVIWLIRHHEAEELSEVFPQGDRELLQKLQNADNNN